MPRRARSALSRVLLAVLVAPTAAALAGGCSVSGPTVNEVGPTPAQAAHVEKLDVVAALKEARGFTTMVTLLERSQYAGSLRREGAWTVFCPTDEAFARLPEGTLATLTAPEGKESLEALVRNHVAEGAHDADALRKMASVEVSSGAKLSVLVEGGTIRVDGATVEAMDLEASNGVLHALDSVLTPKVAPSP